MIDAFQIPLDEYPRRCVNQIERWEKEKNEILQDGAATHSRSKEYASYIMEAIVTNTPYKIGGNVLNHGLIDNLPSDATGLPHTPVQKSMLPISWRQLLPTLHIKSEAMYSIMD